MKRGKTLEHPARSALSACTGPMLVLLVLSLGINLLALTTPLYLLHLYSHVIPSASIDTLIVLTAMALAALLAFVVLEALRKRSLARLADWYDDAVRPAALRAGIDVALEGERGDAARLWREVSAVRGFLASSHVTTLLDVPWVPVFLLALFLVHPALGIIALVGGAVLALLALLGDILVRGASATSQGAAKRAEARWDTLLGSARAIRAMGLLPGVSRTLYALHDDMLEHNETAERRGAAIEACSRFVRLSTQIAVMAGATVLVVSYGLNPGAIFAASLLLSRALAPVERAMPVWRAISTVRPALRHLDEATTRPALAANAVALPEPIGRLSVEAVTHRPAGRRDATLRRISFEAEPGDILGVVGPSGSGKSTIARIIVGALDPSIGRVRMDGADISLWQAAGAERHIGYLPQQVELAGETVRDAIARMEEHDPADVFEAAKRAGVHEAIMRMERGYETPLGDGGGSLSGGQRQLVGLARALYGSPRLLVLDEPNAALDTQGEGHLRRAIVDAARNGATVIVVAQHSSILDVATRRLVLDDGVVVSLGTPSHVLSTRKSASAAPPVLPNPLDPSLRKPANGTEAKRARMEEDLVT